MDLLKNTISIGIDKPFTVLHLSDSHICRADERNDERKLRLASDRGACFDQAEANLREQLAYADAHHLPILYTGDFCDFVSYANLEYMREQLFSRDCFMAVGNHEFSLYVGEAFEDEPYKMQSYDLVQSFCPDDLRFASRVMGGINFVVIDNVYYHFQARQLEQLKAEVAKGLPIVLMLHNPLYTPDLAQRELQKNPCAYVVGAPEALLQTYPEDRRLQQTPTADTLAMIEYIDSQPSIRAILAGHLHDHYETLLPSGIPQYITGGGYRNQAREIVFC